MKEKFIQLSSMATICFVLVTSQAIAGEGGTSHITPGATATLSDFPGTAPAQFVKFMYVDYSGEFSAQLPTAAGITSNIQADSNTIALVAGKTFEKTVLGGAHYSMAIAVPYTSLEVSGRVSLPGGGSVARSNSVSGLGDITLMPAMLAWKRDEWQFNAMLPIYAPTGNYELGRIGNTGLNYWTFDPTIGAVYTTKKGFNAMLHMGYAINTENSDTNYKSGSLLHFEGALQQILPVGDGFLTLGAEAFYFKQVTGDSGSGATLGNFKGNTSGIGPAFGYIKPLGKQLLIVDLKWLKETDTEKRLKGDYLWLKVLYKF